MKYSVPFNLVKLSNAMLLRNFLLELIFKLKERGRENT